MKLAMYLEDNRRPMSWVAKATGTTRQAVYRWCNFLSTPSDENMKVIESITEGNVTRADFHEVFHIDTKIPELEHLQRLINDTPVGVISVDAELLQHMVNDLERVWAADVRDIAEAMGEEV